MEQLRVDYETLLGSFTRLQERQTGPYSLGFDLKIV